ncbi:MAG: endonuclease domain-containing protein [Dehalococcoidia bacterium]
MTNQRDRADFTDNRRRRVAMRRTPPEGERLLWYKLRNRNLENMKFRRQHQMGLFIADFYCDEQKLVVEVDGWQHFDDAEIASDEARTGIWSRWDFGFYGSRMPRS